MDPLTIGRKVARLRKEQGLTTTQLARQVGLSQPQISRLENGHQGFRSATLQRIADALGVPSAYFFEEDAALVEAAQKRRRARRRELGRDLARDIELQYGTVAVTPGYQAMLRRLTAALAKPQTDPRTLRRLVDRILSLSNEERTELLKRLSRK